MTEVYEAKDDFFAVPQYFLCPLTKDIMLAPSILLSDGQTYEKEALEAYLAENEVSPSGAELSSKKFCPNWALKRIIQDWRQHQASEERRAEQRERLEGYLDSDGPYASLFDVTFFVGPDQQVFRSIRAMMSSLCPFFKKLLNEDKDVTDFELPDVSPECFQQVLRLAYNLDPGIDSENVLDLLSCSNVLKLGMLKDVCLVFLSSNISIPKVAKDVMMALEPNNDFGIDEKLRDEFIGLLISGDLDGGSAMTVFNSALALKVLTPELETKICKVFTGQTEAVVNASSFLFTRLELMLALVEADVFCVNEELLWRRICSWAIKQADLESDDAGHRPIDGEEAKESGATPGGDDDWAGRLGMMIMTDELQEKYVKATSADFPEAAMKYLKQIMPACRFPLMDPAFFIDQVAPLLTREMASNVLIHLNEPANKCMFNSKKRFDVSGAGGGGVYTVVAAHPELQKARSLPDMEVETQWSRVSMTDAGGKQWFVTDCGSKVNLTKFDWKNYYNDDDTIHTVELYMLPPDVDVEFSDALATGDEHWEKIQDIEIEKSTEWQQHPVTQPDDKKGQYFKWVVTSVYGSEGRYTCLNHLKLHYQFEWKTNFANKIDS